MRKDRELTLTRTVSISNTEILCKDMLEPATRYDSDGAVIVVDNGDVRCLVSDCNSCNGDE